MPLYMSGGENATKTFWERACVFSSVRYNEKKGGISVERDERRGLSQEGLKAIACLSMLLDHVGAVFVPGYYGYYALRIVGRIAFPIYCFLLAEGAFYTRNRRKYALRLGIGAVLSEIPFDLAFYGRLTLAHQSVMLTLLLGLGALSFGRRRHPALRWLITLVLAGAAEWLNTDYGGWGVLMIAGFGLVRETGGSKWGMAALLGAICLMMDSARLPFLGNVPIELFALGAMIPIALYSGRKRTAGKGISLAFYSFYPVHLLVLWLLRMV